MDAATLAGMVSTVLFAAANLPMLVKAVHSGDLRSYSLSALALGNVGNAVYTVYVLSLPFGPIWILHGFYLTTMAIMLVLYALSARARRRSPEGRSPRKSSRRQRGDDDRTAARHRRGRGIRVSALAR